MLSCMTMISISLLMPVGLGACASISRTLFDPQDKISDSIPISTASAEFGVPDDVLPLDSLIPDTHPTSSYLYPSSYESNDNHLACPTYEVYDPTLFGDDMAVLDTSNTGETYNDERIHHLYWQLQSSSSQASLGDGQSDFSEEKYMLPHHLPHMQSQDQPQMQSAEVTPVPFQQTIHQASCTDGTYKAMLHQPGELLAMISQQTTPLSGTQEIDRGESSMSQSQSHWPPLPHFKWQYKLLNSQVKKIHERLTSPWPTNLSDQQAKRHLQRASKWLNYHEDIVMKLLNDDEKTWRMVSEKCMPNTDEPEWKSPMRREKKVCMLEPVWLARPILSTKKSFIVTRLARHWVGISEALVQNRIIAYADKYGKLSSPEPLLDDDEEQFKMAADAIYCQDAPHGRRHVGASEEDLLHQYSQEYSVPIEGQPGKPARLRRDHVRFSMEAPRFHTGHTWLDSITPIEIDRIHKMIRSNWKDRIHHYVLQEAFEQVNEMLAKNQGLLEGVKKGDAFAAYIVASRCIKPFYMKQQKC